MILRASVNMPCTICRAMCLNGWRTGMKKTLLPKRRTMKRRSGLRQSDTVLCAAEITIWARSIHPAHTANGNYPATRTVIPGSGVVSILTPISNADSQRPSGRDVYCRLNALLGILRRQVLFIFVQFLHSEIIGLLDEFSHRTGKIAQYVLCLFETLFNRAFNGLKELGVLSGKRGEKRCCEVNDTLGRIVGVPVFGHFCLECRHFRIFFRRNLATLGLNKRPDDLFFVIHCFIIRYGR